MSQGQARMIRISRIPNIKLDQLLRMVEQDPALRGGSPFGAHGEPSMLLIAARLLEEVVSLRTHVDRLEVKIDHLERRLKSTSASMVTKEADGDL